MRGKSGKAALAICLTLILSLTACGDIESEETTAPVQESEAAEIETEPEEVTVSEVVEVKIEEEVEEEPEEIVTYVEENGLEYSDFPFVKVTGLAMNSSDHSDYIETDADFEWEIVSIEDAEEEGYKTITVLETMKGYRWYDGRVMKTYAEFPSFLLADSYTGVIVPSEDTYNEETVGEHGIDVEWNDEIYRISYVKDVKWDFEDEWKPLTGDTFAGWCTAYETLTITVPENYDGLALLLPPVLLIKEETSPDEHIMDYYADEDFYLFKVDVNAETEDKESNTSEESDPDEADSSTTTSKSEETKSQTTKQEETKDETPKQAHSHSYVETVTANPTCSNPGTKTFTCSCGDSYTESIPATGEHQWVENTEIVHHDEVGHNESTPIEVNTFHCRGCGGEWTSLDEFRYHGCTGGGGGSFYYTTETSYESEWVVDQEAWDEPITSSTCSVCGATR